MKNRPVQKTELEDFAEILNHKPGKYAGAFDAMFAAMEEPDREEPDQSTKWDNMGHGVILPDWMKRGPL